MGPDLCNMFQSQKNISQAHNRCQRRKARYAEVTSGMTCAGRPAVGPYQLPGETVQDSEAVDGLLVRFACGEASFGHKPPGISRRSWMRGPLSTRHRQAGPVCGHHLICVLDSDLGRSMTSVCACGRGTGPLNLESGSSGASAGLQFENSWWAGHYM